MSICTLFILTTVGAVTVPTGNVFMTSGCLYDDSHAEVVYVTELPTNIRPLYLSPCVYTWAGLSCDAPAHNRYYNHPRYPRHYNNQTYELRYSRHYNYRRYPRHYNNRRYKRRYPHSGNYHNRRQHRNYKRKPSIFKKGNKRFRRQRRRH